MKVESEIKICIMKIEENKKWENKKKREIKATNGLALNFGQASDSLWFFVSLVKCIHYFVENS